MKKKNKEALLAERVATYLKTVYPMQPFRFDTIDSVGLQNGAKNKALHGKWARGYPDLLIMKCTKKYGGLYLELKATKSVHNSEHTRRQRVYHEVLRNCGYKVEFACGYDEAVMIIDKYLK